MIPHPDNDNTPGSMCAPPRFFVRLPAARCRQPILDIAAQAVLALAIVHAAILLQLGLGFAPF